MPAVRTKTFTGCWTCRARKIKCDLQRPFCQRCEKANVKCEGYDLKLRWTQGIGTDGPTGSPSTSRDETEFFQRRNVNFVEYPPDMKYETYEDMDITLAKLHAPVFETDNETMCLGPFGVFEAVKAPKSAGRGKRQALLRSTSAYSAATEKSTPDLRPLKPSIGNSLETNESLADVKDKTQEVLNGPADQPMTLGTPATSVEPLDMDLMVNQKVELDEIVDLGPFTEATDYQTLQDELSALLASDDIQNLVGLGDQMLSIQDIQQQQQQQQQPEVQEQIKRGILLESEPEAQLQPESRPEIPQTVRDLSVESSLFSQIEDHSAFGSQKPAVIFTSEGRYLFEYYVQSVIPIMTVLLHPKNPWKTIYLPRAYRAIGELTSVGKTASSKNAVLHGLLAVAAYHLRGKLPENSKQRAYFDDVGARLKKEAYRWLSDALMRELSLQRYKDLITAVLTMISIDVIAGSMSDCTIHLNACKSLVNARHKSRKQMSNKVLTLHRIAGFLTLLQRATALHSNSLNPSEDHDDEDWLVEVRLDDLDPEPGNSRGTPDPNQLEKKQLSQITNKDEFSTYFDNHVAARPIITLAEEVQEKELMTTLTLYGIPDSLLALFRATVKCGRSGLYYRRNEVDILPDTFMGQCADLEKAIVRWQKRYTINKYETQFSEPQLQALDHHTLAFYHAIVVYYYRLVHNVHGEILETHVSNVLTHLEAIQQLNQPKTICVPLMFPGFIAACEAHATQPQLRDRFQAWLEQFRIQGLGSYHITISVILEVWRRKDVEMPGATWWQVIDDMGINLMLS